MLYNVLWGRLSVGKLTPYLKLGNCRDVLHARVRGQMVGHETGTGGKETAGPSAALDRSQHKLCAVFSLQFSGIDLL